jgi:hypothetical protein
LHGLCLPSGLFRYTLSLPWAGERSEMSRFKVISALRRVSLLQLTFTKNRECNFCTGGSASDCPFNYIQKHDVSTGILDRTRR